MMDVLKFAPQRSTSMVSPRRTAALLCLAAAAALAPIAAPAAPTRPVAKVLERGEKYAVLYKPGGVPCHASDYVGRSGLDEYPLLQRGRDALGRRINLVHRLDRGASGCVLCAYGDDDDPVTGALHAALAGARKTYVALTRGEGYLGDRDFKAEGWFTVERAIKNERGNAKNATTDFRWVASTGAADGARASLVVARPRTGRWHQIRRHLNGLSHPILGDSSHGNTRENRLWRTERGFPGARLALHLCRLEVPATAYTPAVDVSCPLPADLRWQVQTHMGGVLAESRAFLAAEAKIDLSVDAAFTSAPPEPEEPPPAMRPKKPRRRA